MQVKLITRNIEKVQAYIRSIPNGVKRVAMKAITEYIIGDQRHGLKHYQPYKYITREKAYGKTFVSDKQRRFVMAAIREGRIDPGAPHRTGKTQRAWTMNETQRGYNVVNPEVGAYFTRHDKGQARLNMLAGWLKVAEVVANNMAGAIRHANAAIRQFLKGK